MSEEIKVNTIPLIRQNVFTANLDGINHSKIASDIKSYGKTINQDCGEYGWISRGFVQYEDIVVPITPEITKLENTILNVIEELTGKKYKIDDMWAVNLLENQSVIAHSHYSNFHFHPDEYYSIAYYPEAGCDSAELIFTSSWCEHMNGTTSIKPATGMLVLFNSYIKHMTARQKSSSPRLVLSMNLSPIQPNVSPNADWSVYWDRPIIDNQES
jgi:hypothetical protein